MPQDVALHPMPIRMKIFGTLLFDLQSFPIEDSKEDSAEVENSSVKSRRVVEEEIEQYLNRKRREINSLIESEIGKYLPYAQNAQSNISFSKGSVWFDGQIDIFLQLDTLSKMGVVVDALTLALFLKSAIEAAIKFGIRQWKQNHENLPPLDSVEVNAEVLLEPNSGVLLESNTAAAEPYSRFLLRRGFPAFEPILLCIIFILIIITVLLVLISMVTILQL